jgi:peptidoglycan/LPS O-acetylase OafA/YrhL
LLKLPKHTGTFCFFLALVGYLVATQYEVSGVIKLLWLYIFFSLCCLEAFVSDQGSAKWLNITAFRWLGNMSYSYYLMHSLALKATFMIFGFFVQPTHQFELLFWLAIPILFVATLIPSFLLFVWFEKPFSLDMKEQKNS